jgi:hypothetical protein
MKVAGVPQRLGHINVEPGLQAAGGEAAATGGSERGVHWGTGNPALGSAHNGASLHPRLQPISHFLLICTFRSQQSSSAAYTACVHSIVYTRQHGPGASGVLHVRCWVGAAARGAAAAAAAGQGAGARAGGAGRQRSATPGGGTAAGAPAVCKVKGGCAVEPPMGLCLSMQRHGLQRKAAWRHKLQHGSVQ